MECGLNKRLGARINIRASKWLAIEMINEDSMIASQDGECFGSTPSGSDVYSTLCYYKHVTPSESY